MGDASATNTAPASDDSEFDSESIQLIKTLGSSLNKNPYNYSDFVKYITLLRVGITLNLDNLREARETMSATFPLSSSLWLEWIRDEASLASSENWRDVVKLYERGLSDFESVSLWCDYLDFLLKFDSSYFEYHSQDSQDTGILEMRSLFERAIPTACCHFPEGNRIWEAYRDFEQSIRILSTNEDEEERHDPIPRIRSLFHRQLSVPLQKMSSTLAAYNAWESNQCKTYIDKDIYYDWLKLFPSVKSAYEKARNLYLELDLRERQLSMQGLSDEGKLRLFTKYIQYEQESGDPIRVQALYERAVAEFPVSRDLWTGYTCYLDKTLKVGKAIMHAYSRATRCCPCTGDLWARYLLALERNSASEKEICAVFEKSFQFEFSSLEKVLDLYLTRVDGMRRRKLDYSLIRKTLEKASDHLTPEMQNTDGLLHLHAYWANLELNVGNDVDRARGVWESFMKDSRRMLAAWNAYIDMEVNLGNIEEARSIYRRCYKKKFDGTGSKDICHGWLRFEREHGALVDFDYASEKVTKRLGKLNSQKSRREKRKAGSNVEEESLAKRRKINRPVGIA